MERGIYMNHLRETEGPPREMRSNWLSDQEKQRINGSFQRRRRSTSVTTN